MTARKAAVLGSPVAHSRSPQLHLAAYRALGLADWTYQRIECTAAQLPALLGAFGPEWVGVSVTMPGKFAALQFADERTERAELVGSANTLVRTANGWRADNTDIDGVTGALSHRPLRQAVVLGSGGTAPAAVVALAELGVGDLTVAARNREAAARLIELGTTLSMRTSFCDVADVSDLAERVRQADALVSTIPAIAATDYRSALADVPVLLDAIYDPWPTPLAQEIAGRGGEVIGGLQMLLHQAFSQVEQFTGLPAPRQQMAAALA